MSDAAKPANGNGAKRKRLLIILGLVVVVGAVLWGIYWFAYAQFFESTDDAYVAGDIVSITSREPATVLALHADNTQAVRRGQLLIELDPATAKVTMQSAQADLARTIRSVRSDFSKVHQFDSQIAAAKVQLAQAQGDYRRRKEGSVDGWVSG
jgi:membrane fusion protein (multidrug efflux system)